LTILIEELAMVLAITREHHVCPATVQGVTAFSLGLDEEAIFDGKNQSVHSKIHRRRIVTLRVSIISLHQILKRL
jgi:hypothetical protein